MPSVLFWTSKRAMGDVLAAMAGKDGSRSTKRSIFRDPDLTRIVTKAALVQKTWIQRLHALAKGLKDHLPGLWDATKFADHALDPEKTAEYVRRIAVCSNATFAASMAATIARVRYITVAELKSCIDLLVENLNLAKRRALEVGKEVVYCVAAPPNSERRKSNMWITLYACSMLDFNLAFDMWCLKDCRAMQHLAEVAVTKEVHVLTFDDVMYSGDQMSRTIFELRQQLPFRFIVYACVPFVHRPEVIDIIHPYVRDQVQTWSASLPLVRDFMDFTKFSSGTAAMDSATLTLTYTQSKMPDMMSFPSALSTASNPFIVGTAPWEAYRRDFGAFPLHSLVRNCTTGLCPAGGYKDALLAIPARKCSDNNSRTGSACVQLPTLLQRHGLSSIEGVTHADIAHVYVGPPAVELAAYFQSTGIVLPPCVAVKTPSRKAPLDTAIGPSDGLFTIAELQQFQPEAAALRRVQGIAGVVRYYGCYIAAGRTALLHDPKKISRLLMQTKAAQYNANPANPAVSEKYQYGMVMEDLTTFSVPTNGKVLPEELKRRITEAVVAVHRRGVVHCNLRLSNILVSPNCKDFRVVNFEHACIFNHLSPAKYSEGDKPCALEDREKAWDCLVRRDLHKLYVMLNM